tara:strand:- start:10224 stop:11192 length:969 start_codon:yes stop_codon:yes gene_type:complete
MPTYSVAYLAQDGELTTYGQFGETAHQFYDRSGNTLISGVPSSATHSWDVATTAEMTLSATVLNVRGNDIDMGTQGARIDLDTDNDTSLRASADDTVVLEVGATDYVTVTLAGGVVAAGANSGAVSALSVSNTSNDSSAGAVVEAIAAGSSASGDAVLRATETSGTIISIGSDISGSIGVIAMNTALGSADGDAIRFTDATPPVQSFNAAHSTTTFDYVCETCGEHAGKPFECHGVLAPWHDDVLALATVLDSATGMRFTGDEPGIQQLAKMGVMEVTPSDWSSEAGKNWIGLRPVAAQWYTWSGMYQMYQRIKALEAAVGV